MVVAGPKHPRFAALREPQYRHYFIAVLLAMTADNIEHVISYWVIFQKFHSPALAGFAVIGHWVPYLLLSISMGALADRCDCRKLIHASQALFMLASGAWAVFFITGTLQIWHAAVILVVHGVAGVAGASAIQLVLHEMVAREHLQSAIRLNASSRYLSLLLGPALGGGLMLLVGPAWGLLVNVLIYAPLTLLLLRIPYTGRTRGPDHPRPASGGPVAEALRVLGDVRFDHQILMMIVLGGAASFFVGNAFQAQMPRYAQDLGADEAGGWYSILLAVNAAGAVLGAVLLETVTVLRVTTRTSMVCAIAWGGTIGLFPAAQSYGLAVTLLVLAGVFDIAFTSSAQTLVQVHAPPRLRGRVVGVFNTAVLGLRAGSGITVGILGAVIDVNWSLALSAAAVVATGVSLLAYESTRVDDGRGVLRRADGAK